MPGYRPLQLDQKGNTSIKIFGHLPRNSTDYNADLWGIKRKSLQKHCRKCYLAGIFFVKNCKIVNSLKHEQETAVNSLLHGRDVMGHFA